MIKHLYIECTHTANSGLNTGIQRVVRHIVEQLGPRLPDNTPISLMCIDDGSFYRLDGLPDLRRKQLVEDEDSGGSDNDNDAPPENRGKIRVVRYLRNLREAVLKRLTWAPLNDFLSAPRSKFGLSRIIYMLTLIGVYRSVASKIDASKCEAPCPISFSPGDVILMLDSSWHLPAWEAISHAKDNGANVIVVIYDLIPITHPQFCEQALCKVFSRWFEQAEKNVDGYIAISKTVRCSLQDYLISLGATPDSERLGYFYLGADVAKEQGCAREELMGALKGSSYLIVSTVEPRKNHQYLLDSFNQLWALGLDIKLHIVGRVGWRVDKLIRDIEQHPQFNAKLFLWNDLDDAELVYCYKNSKALVFPSYVEGFGLPIIEAQHYQLPVLASDTPIHREVGGGSVIYFDLADSADLVTKISDVEQGCLSLNEQAHFDLNQYTWQHSANRLVQEIRRIQSVL